VEAESAVLWVMSGDKFEWEVEISSQSRIHMVYAFFFKETEDPNPRKLALGGEVYAFKKQKDRRTNHVILRSEGHANLPEIEAGDYRLSSMQCITSSGTTLDIDLETLPAHYQDRARTGRDTQAWGVASEGPVGQRRSRRGQSPGPMPQALRRAYRGLGGVRR
jgi:hypothetical protein